MKGEKDQAITTAIVPSANTEGVSREAIEKAERHLDAIAQAIGRHMAREHIKAWDAERRKKMADDGPPK